MKITQQYLWILIRIQIIFEMTRHYQWKCSLIELQDWSENEKNTRKSKECPAIIETVAFYKNLPIPDADLGEFGVKNGSTNHYLFESISSDLISRHLFNHLSPAAHFGYRENNDGGIRLYSGNEIIVTVDKDLAAKFSDSQRACELVLFLNSIFGIGQIPTEDEFQGMDIKPILDAIATPVVVK